MKFSEWYEINKNFIDFNQVIIKCVKLRKDCAEESLFQCALDWKEAIRMFGVYHIRSISQGYHVTDYKRQEGLYTLMCTVWLPEESATDV